MTYVVTYGVFLLLFLLVIGDPFILLCLCDLLLYIPINNFSVMSGLVFLG